MQAQIISYEEYYPYGSTSYQAGRSAAEVSLKRYRYTGKERDEESGLYYHGARYYAPWTKRWLSCDPAGGGGTQSLYEYCSGNPTRFIDPTGEDSELAEQRRLVANESAAGAHERMFKLLDTDASGRLDAKEVLSTGGKCWGFHVIEGFLSAEDSTGRERFTENGWLAQEEVLAAANWPSGKNTLGLRPGKSEAIPMTKEQHETAVHAMYQARLKGFEAWQGVVASSGLGGGGRRGPTAVRGSSGYQSGAPLDPPAIRSPIQGSNPVSSGVPSAAPPPFTPPAAPAPSPQITRWFFTPSPRPAAPGDPALAAARNALPLGRNRVPRGRRITMPNYIREAARTVSVVIPASWKPRQRSSHASRPPCCAIRFCKRRATCHWVDAWSG